MTGPPSSLVFDAVSMETTCLRSEVEAEIGPPSCAVGDMVWCYAPATSSEGWVFFDFARERVLQYKAGKGRYQDLEWKSDPLLRNVRVPAPDFDSGLVLTLYGKVCRWGTGWWIVQAEQGRPNAPDGIAGQFRDVAARTLRRRSVNDRLATSQLDTGLERSAVTSSPRNRAGTNS